MLDNSSKKIDLIPIAVLLLLTIAFFPRAAFLKGAFFVQDIMFQNYPFRHYFSQALKEWSLPLWCPNIGCGFPLFAEGQSGVLYPINLILSLLLPTWAAINYNIIIHIFLAGLFTYLYLKTLDLDPFSALTGAITFAFCGFLTVHLMSLNFIDVLAWLPLSLMLIELAFKKNKLIYIVLSGLILGIQLLAGHPQAVLYCILVTGLYLIFKSFTSFYSPNSKVLFLSTVLLCSFITLSIGIIISSVQILPTYELIQHSARSGGGDYGWVASQSLPPRNLITFIFPNFFGNTSNYTYWAQHLDVDSLFFLQLCGYIGIIPLMLSASAFVLRNDKKTLFFAALLLLSLLLSLGKYTVLYRVLYYVPGFSLFRSPARFLVIFSFSISVLSALGLQSFIDSIRIERTDERRIVRTSLILIVGIWIMVIAACLFYANSDFIFLSSEQIERLFSSHAYSLKKLHSTLVKDLIRFALVTASGIVLLCFPKIFKAKGELLLKVLIPVMIVSDLFSFGIGFNATINPKVYLHGPQTAEFLEQDRTFYRIFSNISESNSPFQWHQGWANEKSSYTDYYETLRMYSGTLYGLHNFSPGWSPLHLQRHWDLAGGQTLNKRIIDLSNVKYVITYDPIRMIDLELVFEGKVKIYENKRALERAFIAYDFEVIPERGDRLKKLKDPSFKPDQTVIIEEGVPDHAINRQKAEMESTFAEIVEYTPERVVVEANLTEPGFLVLADANYPGWNVRVDGSKDKIYTANHLFRAVYLSPGRHNVEFFYRSEAFRAGAITSTAALLIVVALIILSLNRDVKLTKVSHSSLMDQSRKIDIRHKAAIVVIVAVIVIVSAILELDLWREALSKIRMLDVWGKW